MPQTKRGTSQPSYTQAAALREASERETLAYEIVDAVTDVMFPTTPSDTNPRLAKARVLDILDRYDLNRRATTVPAPKTQGE